MYGSVTDMEPSTINRHQENTFNKQTVTAMTTLFVLGHSVRHLSKPILLKWYKCLISLHDIYSDAFYKHNVLVIHCPPGLIMMNKTGFGVCLSQ